MSKVELNNFVSLIKLSQPDLMVVSSEGMKFSTWRLLLALHSPFLAELLRTLKPSEEGILAISLPLPYTSVSSMLTILSEGGNLDYLGEAAELFGNSFASKVEGGSSTGRNPISVFEANTNKYSLINLNSPYFLKPALEISSKSDVLDLNVIKDKDESWDTASEKRNGHSGDFKAEHESERFDNVATDNLATMIACDGDKDVTEGNPEDCDSDNNQEDMRDDDGDSKQIQEGGIENVIWCGSNLTPGLTFPDYDSMMTALDDWGQANFSPMITRTSGRRQHTFCCPHRQKKRESKGLGIRQAKKTILEYADCPFLIDTKLNADGSYIVSRAETVHTGHEVSEEQFQKYRRLRRFTTLS